jgi:pyruvate/2-oxoglutarate dehydrogenase complex dihydrolipoamide dehydrogenase (E3) component
MQTETFDAIVIGSGQGGNPLAVDLAKAGHKTALIEREAVGGTCINWGCTPTKTMYASARLAHLARRSSDFGVRTGSVTVSLPDVMRRKRAIVDSFRQGSEWSMSHTPNLELIRGEASFEGARAIDVVSNDGRGERRRVTASRYVFINTGCRSTVPQITGIEHARWVDSKGLLEVDVLPERLVVIGAGYIGLELGQMFARFGSKVSIVQRSAQILSNEDADVAEALTRILRDEGLEILTSTRVERVEAAPSGAFDLVVDVAGRGERRLQGDLLLFAAGRRPNTDALHADAAGIRLDGRGYVVVNDKLETSAEGVYAIGDVKGGPAFTHISWDDYRILRANLIERGAATIEGRLVPYTVFTDPQLGRVGLSEKEARSRARPIAVAKMSMEHSARAVESGQPLGFIKALVDVETQQVLGCAVLGMEGGEIMAMLEIAMLGRLRYPVLKEAIFAHPTLAESLNSLFSSMASIP